MIYRATNRVRDYVGTSTSYEDAVALKDQMLKNIDMFSPKAKRPRWHIRPRLGRGNPYAYLYASGRGVIPRGPLYRPSSQCINREHGTRFDVYVREN